MPSTTNAPTATLADPMTAHEGECMNISMTVNGKSRSSEVEPRTLLVHFLRDDLDLTGTNVGCDTSSCGACTVHIDGQAVRSCVYPVAALTGDEDITTIEGLSEDGTHPVQQAWVELDVPQCRYCQPGMIMAVAGLLKDNPNATDEDIDLEITNICRCGTFQRVREGVHLAKTKKS